MEVAGAEGFEAGHVGDGVAVAAEADTGFEAETVFVGVDEQDGFAEGAGFGFEGGEDGGEAGVMGGTAVCGNGIGLEEKRDARGGGARRFGEHGAEPGDIGGFAGAPFLDGAGELGLVVVGAADEVESGEDHAAAGPARVFDVGGESGIAALGDEVERLRAAAAFVGEEGAAEEGEAFLRLVAGAVGVGPFVVAGRIDECGGERVELRAALQVEGVGGILFAAEDVAEMYGKRGAVAVDFGDDAGEASSAGIAVNLGNVSGGTSNTVTFAVLIEE